MTDKIVKLNADNELVAEDPDTGEEEAVGFVAISNHNYNESVVEHESASGTVSVDLAAANVHRVNAVDDVTIEFANVTEDPAGNSTLIYVQDDDSSGPHTISWPTNVVWDGDDPVNEVEDGSDVEVSLLTDNGGTEWRGRLSGGGFE